MNFVAGAVDDYARMIPIAPHRVARIDVGPLFEIEMVVVRIFCHGPAVKQFIHYQKTHPIAEIQELRSRRIVSCTDCIYAKLLECLKPSLPRAQRHSSAKCARVMMKTNAFYFEVATVEPKTCVRIKVKFPDAEGHRIVIDSLFPIAQPGHSSIKVRMIQVPKLRITKLE